MQSAAVAAHAKASFFSIDRHWLVGRSVVRAHNWLGQNRYKPDDDFRHGTCCAERLSVALVLHLSGLIEVLCSGLESALGSVSGICDSSSFFFFLLKMQTGNWLLH